jgi:hypothetical protein
MGDCYSLRDGQTSQPDNNLMVTQTFGETVSVGSKHYPQLSPYLDYGSIFLCPDSRNTNRFHQDLRRAVRSNAASLADRIAMPH